MKTTLKEIRTFTLSYDVTDVTNWKSADLQALAAAHSFTTIVYSVGMYGMTGKVVRDEASNRQTASQQGARPAGKP